MKSKDNLKKRDGSAASRNGANEHTETDCILLADEELDTVAGGSGGDNNDWLDPSKFVEMIVVSVDNPSNDRKLRLRSTPNGSMIENAFWNIGDLIQIHRNYKENGWYHIQN